MKAGTKTILFGYHQFFLHPIFVLIAWIFLYHSFPKLSELLAIITHDWGLWGQPNLDGEEGEKHPQIIFDWWSRRGNFGKKVAVEVIGHSRYYANKQGLQVSKLYYADKLSIGFYPMTLYLLLGTLSGEIEEYRNHGKNGKYQFMNHPDSKVLWFLNTRSTMVLLGLKNLPHNWGIPDSQDPGKLGQ